MIETGEDMPNGKGDQLTCTECGAKMTVKPGNTVPACEECGGTEFETAAKA
jgi:hypothetical protein